MIAYAGFKKWLTWRLIGPHLCTLAVALSFNSIWHAPRAAFRYGALQSLLPTTVALAAIALPVVLLQLAVGQLSQQDAVGIWRAVPFFKGVGYVRLLISFLCSVYSLLYVAISIIYLFYTLRNSMPYWDCVDVAMPSDIIGDENDVQIPSNATDCLNEAFLVPVSEQPEYYVALAFIVIVLWILFPFILYNPVKLMKRILYVLGPLVLLLGIVVLTSIGNKGDVTQFSRSSDWANFVQPNIWHGALVQALLSSQTAGGYLITSGDSIYTNTNVLWTSLIFVGTNIVASWAGVLFWFAIGGNGTKVTNNLAVLAQLYKVASDSDISTVWPLLCFVMLALSGIISMMTFLHPLYDRFRRMGGYKWRHVSMCSSAAGAVGGLALVAVADLLPALEDVAVPCLVTVATLLEIAAFVFIYGWKVLVEDIEFLTGSKLHKIWVMGWYSVPGVIFSIMLWWSIYWLTAKEDWREAPWEAAVIVTSLCVVFVLFCIFAVISVAKQVQYDFIGKLKSSFRPSRHWGPRDPITHHYWLARREEINQSVTQTRYNRRQLGEFSGGSSFADVIQPSGTKEEVQAENKRRSNSDDWLVIIRRQSTAELYKENSESRKRSKSLDWAGLPRVRLQRNGYTKQTNEDISRETPSDLINSVRETKNIIIFDVKTDLHV